MKEPKNVCPYPLDEASLSRFLLALETISLALWVQADSIARNNNLDCYFEALETGRKSSIKIAEQLEQTMKEIQK